MEASLPVVERLLFEERMRTQHQLALLVGGGGDGMVDRLMASVVAAPTPEETLRVLQQWVPVVRSVCSFQPGNIRGECCAAGRPRVGGFVGCDENSRDYGR